MPQTREISSSNLLTRLFIIVAVATVPAIVVLVTLQRELQAGRMLQARGSALRQAELLNLSVGTIAEGARQLMISITHYERVRRLDPTCASALEGLQTGIRGYAFLAVTDSEGRPVCASSANPQPLGTLQSLAAAAVAAGRFSIGHYVSEGDPAHPYLSFGLPFLLGDGVRQGVVIAGLDLHWLDEFLATIKRPSNSVLSVVDRDGTVLARQPDSERYVGRPVLPAVRALLAQPQNGTAIVPTFEGHQRVVGYVPITQDPASLYVSAGFLLDDLTADIDAAARRGYLMMAAGAALSLLLALAVGQRFVRAPTAVLLKAARGWGGGDLNVRAAMPRGSAREFCSLGHAFNEMARTLEQQRAELQSLNGALEARVSERTRALLDSNNRLQLEIAEREVTEGQLRQAQKLQAVGQLAGGIAHDFNNLLTAVLGCLELLQRRVPPGDHRLRHLLDTATAAVGRGTRLTSKLLGFSRKQPLLAVPVDVTASIEGMASLLASTLGAAIWIETDLAPDLWAILVDPNQFEAAILNLALNARDAMPAGGRLTVTGANGVVPAQTAGGLPPGDYVRVTVADTGCGMSADVMARAFEPFFTTQGPGMASGLGLSQIHGMAQQSGGDVTIESRVGEGTRVSLMLPRSRRAPVTLAQGLQPARLAAVADSGGLLLLVDDDPDVREVTAALLTESGYGVVQVADGPSALARLDELAERIQFVVADYAMPGMTGRELLSQIRRLRPGLPMLLITGYADFGALAGDGLAADQIVRKPFRSSELIARIQMAQERQLSLTR